MQIDPWQEQMERELEAAAVSRAAGNEGRARVCARRAAGYLLGEYFRRRGIPDPGPSAIDRLRFQAAQPGASQQQRSILAHLLLHVDPDHNLPPGVDLIAEVRWLVMQLLE